MMTNLFSMFDPSMMKFKMAWTPCLLLMIIFPFVHKALSISKTYIGAYSLNMFLSKELKSLMAPNIKKMSSNILIMLFFGCLFTNMMALTPFTFTPTAHLSISFTMAILFWFSFMSFGWKNNFSTMMAHMVPTGTPVQLMNFMVIIELVSNLIRPITLSVRLSANMVAGHLLMSLLGSFCLSTPKMLSAFPVLVLLSVLEIGVSFIQAYVLMTLVTLYSTEVH